MRVGLVGFEWIFVGFQMHIVVTFGFVVTWLLEKKGA